MKLPIKAGIIDRFLELKWYSKILCIPGIIVVIPVMISIGVAFIIAKSLIWASYVLFDDY